MLSKLARQSKATLLQANLAKKQPIRPTVQLSLRRPVQVDTYKRLQMVSANPPMF